VTFARPTLSELRSRVAADYASRLGLSGLLPRSVLLALANSEASAVHLLHGHLEYLALQQFPQTADRDGLLRWADLRGVQRKAATFASGTITFTGTAGSAIPSGMRVARADGALFGTTAVASVGVGGSAAVPTQAVAAGSSGDCAIGLELSLTTSIVGVASVTTVASPGLVGGFDAEDDEALRTRVLDRWREPVLGGAAADFVTWALEVPGVTRAWCYPTLLGPGTVGVSFAVDDAAYGPIPLSSDVDLVREHLDLLRPVTSQLFVYAPTALPLAVTLEVTPDTADVRAAVEASVHDLLRRESEPGGTLIYTHLQEAISLAAGETDHVLTVPAGDLVAGPGELLVPGPFSFV
jgi:uncharacterized phage protein gp47/JayE